MPGSRLQNCYEDKRIKSNSIISNEEYYDVKEKVCVCVCKRERERIRLS